MSTDSAKQVFPAEMKALRDKFMKHRVVVVFTPFTIAMTVGFIALAALLGSWATSPRPQATAAAASGFDQQGVGRLPCKFDIPEVYIRDITKTFALVMGYNTWNAYGVRIDISICFPGVLTRK